MGGISNRHLSKDQWELVRVGRGARPWSLVIRNEDPSKGTTFRVGTGTSETLLASPESQLLGGVFNVTNGSATMAATTGGALLAEVSKGDLVAVEDRKIIVRVGSDPVNNSELQLAKAWPGKTDVGVPLYLVTPTPIAFEPGDQLRQFQLPLDSLDTPIYTHSYFFIQAESGPISYDLSAVGADVRPLREGYGEFFV